ncbi:MAG TPA: carbon-nitrogen hydrolase family protein [Gammaproteobacteria bacterium]
MSKRTFRAAVVQTLARLGDIEANIALLQSNTREAVRQGARLVVFPECMNSGYLFDSKDHCRDIAEPLNGRFVQAMADLCRQHNIFIASGFTELDEASGKIFNSGLLLDPKGDLILHYHKQFLATHDQNWFEFGVNGCPVVDTELGRIGLLICFDGRIPEIARCLALQGAEVIVDMANFFAMDQADLWVPARAYENGFWIVAATKAGVERSIYYPGGSMIVAPSGEVRGYVPVDTHGVVSAEIDPEAASDKRWFQNGDRFRDRRPETYGLLIREFNETPLAQLLKRPLVPEQATAKAAAVQAHANGEFGSLEAAIAIVEHTARLGVKLIVLPQHFGLDFWLPSEAEAHAGAQQVGSLVDTLSSIARKYASVIVLPVIELNAGGLDPCAIVIGADGQVIGRQRQLHLEPELRSFCQAGENFEIFETPYGRLGVVLGYDGMFPESTRILALLGADVVAWPSAWRQPQDRKLLAVPKAEDNRLFVICANRSDAPYPGGSFVISPTGFPSWDLDVVSPPVRRHGAVIPGFMNLALARQKSMIPKVDMLRNRLTDTYTPLVQPFDDQ